MRRFLWGVSNMSSFKDPRKFAECYWEILNFPNTGVTRFSVIHCLFCVSICYMCLFVCVHTSPAVLTSHCPQIVPLSLFLLVVRWPMAGGRGSGGWGGTIKSKYIVINTWQGDFIYYWHLNGIDVTTCKSNNKEETEKQKDSTAYIAEYQLWQNFCLRHDQGINNYVKVGWLESTAFNKITPQSGPCDSKYPPSWSKCEQDTEPLPVSRVQLCGWSWMLTSMWRADRILLLLLG